MGVRVVWAAALLLGVSASVAAGAQARIDIAAEEQRLANKPIPKSIWQTDDADVATNLQSGLRCDRSVGKFERTMLLVYDSFGFDVSCNYKNASGDGVTIYLTQRGRSRTLADDLEEAKRGLLQLSPDARALPDDPQQTFPSDLTWLHLVYAEHAGVTNSGIWIADLGGWTLEFRATYPPADNSSVQEEMSLLTTAAEKSAGKHLTACSKAPPVVRSGAPLEDKQKLSALSLMWAMTQAVGEQKSPSAEAPVEWCVEQVVADEKTPMILWRNIAGDGQNGPLDRVMLMTIDVPPSLICSGDSMLSEIEASHGNQVLIYPISFDGGERASLIGLYAGRPSADALIATAKKVFTGSNHPLSSYSRSGKSIDIALPPEH